MSETALGHLAESASHEVCAALTSAVERVSCFQQVLNVTEPPSIYTYDEYQSVWLNTVCLLYNVTLGHRVLVHDDFTYCTVPLSGQDTFLFVGIAFLVAAVFFGKLSAVWVLLFGAVLGVINWQVNMREVSNAIALWLNISPPDLFFYAFLPPLLVDSAMRIDFFMFRKLTVHAIMMAFVMVVLTALTLTPIILFGLGFADRGWSWVHGALFAAMIAPTDALAAAAILKQGGGPERLIVLMEGEALLNDASSITLFEVFVHIIEHHISPFEPYPSVWSVLPDIVTQTLKLAGIGFAVGLAMSWLTLHVLHWLRWRGAQPAIEMTVIVAVAYLSFYVANDPAQGSGVISVVVFGLYGNATSKWGMLASSEESGTFDAVWDTITFAANGLVFLWSGIAAVNYLIHSVDILNDTAWSYAAIPLIWVFMMLIRFFCLLMFDPLFYWLGEGLTLPDLVFTTWAGLRGAVSLIMVADFVSNAQFHLGDNNNPDDPYTRLNAVNADISLWTSCFVLMTLVINAPSVGFLMSLLRLTKIPWEKRKMRARAKRALERFTTDAVAVLRTEDDEFLHGANWGAILHYVDVSDALREFDLPAERTERRIERGPKGIRGLLQRLRLAVFGFWTETEEDVLGDGGGPSQEEATARMLRVGTAGLQRGSTLSRGSVNGVSRSSVSSRIARTTSRNLSKGAIGARGVGARGSGEEEDGGDDAGGSGGPDSDAPAARRPRGTRPGGGSFSDGAADLGRTRSTSSLARLSSGEAVQPALGRKSIGVGLATGFEDEDEDEGDDGEDDGTGDGERAKAFAGAARAQPGLARATAGAAFASAALAKRSASAAALQRGKAPRGEDDGKALSSGGATGDVEAAAGRPALQRSTSARILALARATARLRGATPPPSDDEEDEEDDEDGGDNRISVQSGTELADELVAEIPFLSKKSVAASALRGRAGPSRGAPSTAAAAAQPHGAAVKTPSPGDTVPRDGPNGPAPSQAAAASATVAAGAAIKGGQPISPRPRGRVRFGGDEPDEEPAPREAPPPAPRVADPEAPDEVAAGDAPTEDELSPAAVKALGANLKKELEAARKAALASAVSRPTDEAAAGAAVAVGDAAARGSAATGRAEPRGASPGGTSPEPLAGLAPPNEPLGQDGSPAASQAVASTPPAETTRAPATAAPAADQDAEALYYSSLPAGVGVRVAAELRHELEQAGGAAGTGLTSLPPGGRESLRAEVQRRLLAQRAAQVAPPAGASALPAPVEGREGTTLAPVATSRAAASLGSLFEPGDGSPTSSATPSSRGSPPSQRPPRHSPHGSLGSSRLSAVDWAPIPEDEPADLRQAPAEPLHDYESSVQRSHGRSLASALKRELRSGARAGSRGAAGSAEPPSQGSSGELDEAAPAEGTPASPAEDPSAAPRPHHLAGEAGSHLGVGRIGGGAALTPPEARAATAVAAAAAAPPDSPGPAVPPSPTSSVGSMTSSLQGEAAPEYYTSLPASAARGLAAQLAAELARERAARAEAERRAGEATRLAESAASLPAGQGREAMARELLREMARLRAADLGGSIAEEDEVASGGDGEAAERPDARAGSSGAAGRLPARPPRQTQGSSSTLPVGQRDSLRAELRRELERQGRGAEGQGAGPPPSSAAPPAGRGAPQAAPSRAGPRPPRPAGGDAGPVGGTAWPVHGSTLTGVEGRRLQAELARARSGSGAAAGGPGRSQAGQWASSFAHYAPSQQAVPGGHPMLDMQPPEVDLLGRRVKRAGSGSSRGGGGSSLEASPAHTPALALALGAQHALGRVSATLAHQHTLPRAAAGRLASSRRRIHGLVGGGSTGSAGDSAGPSSPRLGASEVTPASARSTADVEASEAVLASGSGRLHAPRALGPARTPFAEVLRRQRDAAGAGGAGTAEGARGGAAGGSRRFAVALSPGSAQAAAAPLESHHSAGGALASSMMGGIVAHSWQSKIDRASLHRLPLAGAMTAASASPGHSRRGSGIPEDLGRAGASPTLGQLAHPRGAGSPGSLAGSGAAYGDLETQASAASGTSTTPRRQSSGSMALSPSGRSDGSGSFALERRDTGASSSQPTFPSFSTSVAIGSGPGAGASGTVAAVMLDEHAALLLQQGRGGGDPDHHGAGGHGGGHAHRHGRHRHEDERNPIGSGLLGGAAQAEMRSRLVLGLKRYFHGKRLQGLLSINGLRILTYGCDAALEESHEPLAMWERLEKEIRGDLWTRVVARLILWLAAFYLWLPRWLHAVGFGWVVVRVLALLRSSLGRRMLVACEVAVEYYLALLWSPQIAWLRSAGAPLSLTQEVEAEVEAAYAFIIDREIEAPDRFGAIQSYRAAMAVLRQQLTFIRELYDAGMLDSGERETMEGAVDRRTRHLEITGPVWRPPKPAQVLRTLPFMAHLPRTYFELLLAAGTVRERHTGERFWSSGDAGLLEAAGSDAADPDGTDGRDDGAGEGSGSGKSAGGRRRAARRDRRPRSSRPGAFVVLSGVVRRVHVSPSGERHEYFQGTGGVIGAMLALTGASLPGAQMAIAEGNSLGKGPLLFHVPVATMRRVRADAAAGLPAAETLEREFARLAAAYVLQGMEEETAGDLAAHALVLHVAQQRAKLSSKRRPDASRARSPERAARSAGRAAAGDLDGRADPALAGVGPVDALDGGEPATLAARDDSARGRRLPPSPPPAESTRARSPADDRPPPATPGHPDRAGAPRLASPAAEPSRGSSKRAATTPRPGAGDDAAAPPSSGRSRRALPGTGPGGPRPGGVVAMLHWVAEEELATLEREETYDADGSRTSSRASDSDLWSEDGDAAGAGEIARHDSIARVSNVSGAGTRLGAGASDAPPALGALGLRDSVLAAALPPGAAQRLADVARAEVGELLEAMRRALPSAELVFLPPGERLSQTTHWVLVGGHLNLLSGACPGARRARLAQGWGATGTAVPARAPSGSRPLSPTSALSPADSAARSPDGGLSPRGSRGWGAAADTRGDAGRRPQPPMPLLEAPRPLPWLGDATLRLNGAAPAHLVRPARWIGAGRGALVAVLPGPDGRVPEDAVQWDLHGGGAHAAALLGPGFLADPTEEVYDDVLSGKLPTDAPAAPDGEGPAGARSGARPADTDSLPTTSPPASSPPSASTLRGPFAGVRGSPRANPAVTFSESFIARVRDAISPSAGSATSC